MARTAVWYSLRAPLVELVSTQENPINFRTRGSLSWHRGGFEITGLVNYANSYKDTVSIPNRKIVSWTTLDLNLAYSFEDSRVRWLKGTKLFLNAQNLFDRDPPFYNNVSGVGYDPENASLLNRVVTFYFRTDL